MKEFIKYKLTKKKAIEITIELWKWLDEKPLAPKTSWPGWKKYDYLESGCSCCEYVIRKTRNRRIYKKCEDFCPLYELWPYERQESSEGVTNMVPCMNLKSPYRKWEFSSTRDNRSKYAREIW